MQHTEFEAFAKRLLCEPRYSLQARLDALDVLLGVRPAARLLLPREGPAERMATLLLQAGAAVAVGRHLVTQSIPLEGEVFVNELIIDSSERGANVEVLVPLYIGLNRECSERARDLDETGDDRGFGESLAYPNCCIEAVLRRGSVPAIDECYELYATDGFFEPLTWPAAACRDASLVPHYPCHRNCRPSFAMAAARVEALLKWAPKSDLGRVEWALSATYTFLDDHSIDVRSTPAGLYGRIARPIRRNWLQGEGNRWTYTRPL